MPNENDPGCIASWVYLGTAVVGIALVFSGRPDSIAIGIALVATVLIVSTILYSN